MSKNKDTSLIGLLEIPLGSSRTGPMKRLVADLHAVAEQLDHARNAMVRAWLRWREDHPDWKPPQQTDDKGQPKFTRKGEPILVCPMHPEVIAEDGTMGEWEHVEKDGCKRKVWRRKADGAEGVGFTTWLYHVGRKIAPNVDPLLISAIAKEVVSNLRTDVQHHHGGKHRERWQAILAFDESAPTFRARTIPVPNNSALFCYGGPMAGGKSASKEERKRAAAFGKSAAVVCLPLFSTSAGREVRRPVVTLKIGRFSPGNLQALKRIARSEWAFCDSDLVFKKDRWQLQLTYRQPGEDLQLDKTRVAVLWPQFPEKNQPFFVESLDAGKHWLCGNGLWLAAEFDRLDARRKRIRHRYTVALSGVKGHGRKRYEARLKPWARKTHDCQSHFAHQLANEVVRFCKANNCGTVVYREPTLGIREHLWFGKRGVPFDWTNVMSTLSHTLRYYHIDLQPERANGLELRERFGGAREQAAKIGDKPSAPKADAPSVAENAPRVPENDGGKGDAPTGERPGRFRGREKGEALAGADGSDGTKGGCGGGDRKA